MYSVTFRNVAELSYAANEALNTLCTNLTFAGDDYKKIMFTSCNGGDGKSFTSMHVARTLAGMGKRVVLVDCDLRKSMIAKNNLILGEGPGYGSSHYLAGMASIEEVLYSTNVRNLFIVPCSKTVTNSIPLVSSPRLTKLLDALASRVDYVIVDSPPVGLLIDAARIASNCDGTVLVVKYNAESRREVAEAKQQIEQSGCPVLGVVINQADFNDFVGRKYYYNKYYNRYYDSQHIEAADSK
jgi:capsular exopolysaccharide synthesis family protein